MSDKTIGQSNGGGQSNGHGLVRSQSDVPATVSFARNALAKDALYRELVEVLWRRKWVILSIILVCMVYAYYEIQKMTPIYTSSTRVYVYQNGATILHDIEGVQNNSSANSFMNIQSDIIKSTSIAAATIDALKHTKAPDAPRPVWAPGGWEALNLDPAFVLSRYERKLKTFENAGNPVGQLRGMLTVEIGKNDDSVEITCESPYKDEVALILNKLVETYKAADIASRKSGTANIVEQLQKEHDKIEETLSGKNAEMSKLIDDVSKQTGYQPMPGAKTDPLLDRLQMLSSQWTDATIKKGRAESMLSAAVRLGSDADAIEQMIQGEVANGGPSIQPPVELTQARIRLQELEQEINAYQSLGQNHPFLRDLLKQRTKAQQVVNDLKDQAANTYLKIISQNLARAKQNEEMLGKQYDAQEQLIRTANAGALKSAALDNEIQRLEKLSDTLDNRIKGISVTQDVSAPTINVLEEAQAPFFPSKPQKPKLMGIALAVGMFLGVGSAFLLDWMDHRIRTPDDIRAIVQVPILGLVPHVSRRTAFAQLGQAVHLQPRSAVAESFRTVRMAVHFSGIERSCQKILVTSAVLGDGKTVTASNLAIAIAQAGQRAVIIDADFHRPRQHLIFGTPNEAGLSSVLQGQCPLEDVVLTTPIPRVDILPCGPLPANPYELLNSKAFNEVFEVLKQHYDHIIIDSPPVLAVADALVLAAMTDATILVARMHRSRRQAFEEAVASLGQVGTRVLGVIVNDMRGGKERYSLYRTHYSARPSRLESFDPTRLLGGRKD